MAQLLGILSLKCSLINQNLYRGGREIIGCNPSSKPLLALASSLQTKALDNLNARIESRDFRINRGHCPERKTVPNFFKTKLYTSLVLIFKTKSCHGLYKISRPDCL